MTIAAAYRIRTTQIQGPPGPVPLTGQTSWTPGTIANGAAVTQAVTVAGCLVGQCALGAFSLALPAGVIICAAIVTPGSVTVTIANFSGAPQTLGAGTVTAAALQGT